MDVMNLFCTRRSVRAFTDEPVSSEDLRKILQAGMLAPTGKGIAPWEFLVIEDRATMNKLVGCRAGGAALMKNGVCAIGVFGNTDLSDTCIEDSSSVLTQMHLMASALGLGSCWLQIRLRPADDGTDAAEFVRSVIDYPENMELEAFLVLGHPAEFPAPHDPEAVPFEKVHYETWA
ncbi:MAG: nitroreductase family protein [Clostridia bacterium]|jgi:nitroreductase|nr:nitroreductase family protein [Clostridia bacterium]